MNSSEVLFGDEWVLFFKLLHFVSLRACGRGACPGRKHTKICHHERVDSRFCFSLHRKWQVVLISFHSFPYFCPDVRQARGKKIFQFKLFKWTTWDTPICMKILLQVIECMKNLFSKFESDRLIRIRIIEL